MCQIKLLCLNLSQVWLTELWTGKFAKGSDNMGLVTSQLNAAHV